MRIDNFKIKKINLDNFKTYKIKLENFGIKSKIIYPELENLNVTPLEQDQEFNHVGSYGYDKVIVSKIPDEYITASVINETLNLTRVRVQGGELIL